METNKKILGIGVLIFGIIFLVSIISAIDTFASSNPQHLAPGASSFSYLQRQGVNAFPVFDPSRCEAGQDFILQVAPFGCEPSVVRSDLLEEQNVPVFCQISATQINPLIDINVIDSIYFTNQNSSREVSGVGYHPARAAINPSRGTLVNSPLLENIGYAVIVLRQNPNESSMPDFVEGNLTANIRYDIQNAYGVGQAVFYLPILDNEEWEGKHTQYGFWNGKGFLRADSIDNNGATVSVYLDKENRLSSFTLANGETSGEVYLPGFYCQTGLKLRLNGVENPSTTARIDVNGEIFQVKERESFLDNNCYVEKVTPRGLRQEVKINCKTDDGRQEMTLTVEPEVDIEFGGIRTISPEGTTDSGSGKRVNKKLGDYLYTTINGDFVYIAYIGTKGETKKAEDLFVLLLETPNRNSDDRLSEEQLNRADSFAKTIQSQRFSSVTGIPIADVFAKGIFTYIKIFQEITQFFVKGDTYEIFDLNSDGRNFGGKEINLHGLTSGEDVSIENQEIVANYENALKDYRRIIDNYNNETETTVPKIVFGEKALANAIELANSLSQKEDRVELCSEFNSKYPNSELKPSSCKDSLSDSRTISINGKVKQITFTGIAEPDFEDYGAEVEIKKTDGSFDMAYLKKNQIHYVDDDQTEYIKINSLTEESVVFDTGFNPSSDLSLLQRSGKLFSSPRFTLTKDQSSSFGSGNGAYTFTLKQINLNKVAKVSVVPNIRNVETQANLSYKIGIEKRAIQLSPDKIKEKLDDLNESIEDWNKASDKLGDVTKGLNAACLATGATLTIKNYFNNLDGGAIARQKVMDQTWTPKCRNDVEARTYASLDECFSRNSDAIDRDVEKFGLIIENQEAVTEENACERLDSLKSSIGSSDIDDPRDLDDEPFRIEGDLLAAFGESEEGKCNKITLSQIRDLETYNQIILDDGISEAVRNSSKYQRYLILNEVKIDSQNYAAFQAAKEEFAGLGIPDARIALPGENEDSRKPSNYYGEIAKEGQFSFIPKGELYQPISDTQAGRYIMTLNKNKDIYTPKEIFRVDGTKLSGEEEKRIKQEFSSFVLKDSKLCENRIVSPEVKYFETDPYKGLPAVVPIDVEKGWYASMKQTLPGFGNIRTYDSSGKIASFYLCNVGEDGEADYITAGNQDYDECQRFDPGAGQTYGEFSCLDADDTKNLLSKAERAIQQASNAYEPGLTGYIRVLDQSVKVGTPAVEVPEFQCQNFMSPQECNLLFNVCDPVVCPSSRCNFGGEFHVSNVVQSGIVGSTLLCLPNFGNPAEGGVVVPVCLSGIKAGMDGLISVQENYRDCLQYNLETGETVGICDEIHSIYLCDFFWNQAAPVAQVAIPKIFQFFIEGKREQGGGEYFSVQSAWQNAQNSADYFASYYAKDSFDAFKARAIGSIGSAVCSNFISASYPENVDILDPESPPQYTAWFEEASYTTATVPPTSRYKVFYHIFAGKNIGAYYDVYLKAPVGTSYFSTSPVVTVDSGFIPTGDYASETLDFTAPSGYKELCIRVNEQEECGFGEVTTSFALDFVQKSYLEEQANARNIQTESECVSGSHSLYSFANPNLQAGATEFVDPELYNSGIVRVCSTDNPGKNTDSTRWTEVGTCDNGKGQIKCYMDQKSVKNSLDTLNIGAGEAYAKEQAVKNALSGDFLDEAQFTTELKILEELKIKSDNQGIIEKINAQDANSRTILDKVLEDVKKARLLLIRGDAYSSLTVDEYEYEKRLKEAIKETEGFLDEVEQEEKRGDCALGFVEVNSVCYPVAEDPKNPNCNNGWEFNDYYSACLPKGILEETISSTFLDRINTESKYSFSPSRSEVDVLRIINRAQDKAYGKDEIFNGKRCYCGDLCSSYASLISQYSNAYGIADPILLLAIMMEESSCTYSAVGDDGNSIGLMQINTGFENSEGEKIGWCGKYGLSENVESCKNELRSPQKNIDVSAQILKNSYDSNKNGILFQGNSNRNVKYYEWEAALRGYNGPGKGGNDYYVEEVMKIYQDLLGRDVSIVDKMGVVTTITDTSPPPPCHTCTEGDTVCTENKCKSIGENCRFESTGFSRVFGIITRQEFVGYCYYDSLITSQTPSSNPNTAETLGRGDSWTKETAISKLKSGDIILDSKYSSSPVNEQFVDELFNDGLITSEEYGEITGTDSGEGIGAFAYDTFINYEEDMNYVLNVLIDKSVTLEFSEGIIDSRIIVLRYTDRWEWYSAYGNWKIASEILDRSDRDYLEISQSNLKLTIDLSQMDEIQGLSLLTDKVKNSDEYRLDPLHTFLQTDLVEMTSPSPETQIFHFYGGDNLVHEVYIVYYYNEWYWVADRYSGFNQIYNPLIEPGKVNGEKITEIMSKTQDTSSSKFRESSSLVNSDMRNLIQSLTPADDLYEGAEKIFNYGTGITFQENVDVDSDQIFTEPSLSSSTNSLNLQYDTTAGHKDLKYQDSLVSFNFESSCTTAQKYSITSSLTRIQESTLEILRFDQVSDSNSAEININCDSTGRVISGTDTLVLGEGGITDYEYRQQEGYFLIKKGVVDLYGYDAECGSYTSLHEILHALGFDHSNNVEDIMYSKLPENCGNQLPVIDEDIVDELKRIYSS